MPTIHKNYSLKSLNSFGLDVQAAQYIQLTNVEEVQQTLADKSKLIEPLLVLGGGYNLLFTDDFTGTVLHPLMGGIEKTDETADYVQLRVGAGVHWDDFVAHCVTNGWGGVENLSLIPGNVGACPVQNIGAYGVEVKDTICLVEGVYIDTATLFRFTNAECGFGYRNSIFKQSLKGNVLITYVSFRLSKQPTFVTHYGNIEEELKRHGEVSLATIRKTIVEIRESKLPDPHVLGNAGSFFKNPMVSKAKADALKATYADMPTYPTADANEVKLAAGWLIERCGWKGKRIGNVGVHEHQALVLVNYGGAKAQELVKLSNAIQQSVKQTFDVDIEPEVNFIG